MLHVQRPRKVSESDQQFASVFGDANIRRAAGCMMLYSAEQQTSLPLKQARCVCAHSLLQAGLNCVWTVAIHDIKAYMLRTDAQILRASADLQQAGWQSYGSD